MSDVRPIDANALMDNIESWYNHIGETMNPWDVLIRNVLSSVMDYINEEDTVEAQVPRWIPVTERLPETADDVLVCVTRGFMFVGYFDGIGRGWELYEQSRESVTHWMPLPSAPEEVVR